ncbi:Stk1 family PASTA domain-containing Ser/Thr kinase [Candidatus Clostridium radicumherbarum]|uniref:non-specific serine/threonine protein kinase n=1 Tax=Candidatus Clostridium radicumherbarum TaxID=3381662 RepID=A0ABW8TR75_9CLOT
MMVGTLLNNRYEILEKIGEGGMAKVYKAKDHLLNRYVAVKVLKSEFSKNTEFVVKFKAEAAAAGSMSHSNIVNIFDVGSEENVNYIIMEYVNGRTLKELIIENGRLDYNRALDFGIQIAKALECAHKNNIIHRDIKPQNILVTDDGLVKVTDFGIAKATNSVTITNTNKVIGSAHYFSPEQAKGSVVDGRTDIYSLGVVLYEMVTGRVPYDAESPVSVALKHLQEPVVPPIHLNSNVPEGLNNLILKAMEKEPIGRYQNIKDMLLDLQRIKNNTNYKVDFNNTEDEYTKVMAPINNINDEEDNEDEEDGTKTNKKKLAAILIPLAVLVIAVGVFAGWYMSKKPNLNPSSLISSDTTVPKIIGLSEADAQNAVKANNLKFVVAGNQKSDKPAGTVIACSPDEGSTIKTNQDVRVYISSGPAETLVPNLVGIDITAATDMINNNGFTLGKVDHQFSDTVPKDSIIKQNPPENSPSTAGTKIDLVVSSGPEIKYTTVPDLTNATLDEAKTLLTNSNLKMGNQIVIPTDNQALNGKVANQTITAKSQVKQGTVVDISYYVFTEGGA